MISVLQCIPHGAALEDSLEIAISAEYGSLWGWQGGSVSTVSPLSMLVDVLLLRPILSSSFDH